MTERDELSQTQRGLIEEIEALALTFSPKASELPPAAWRFWFDAVKGSRPSEVRQAISNWSKTQSRMMTPSDLYKALQTIRTNRQEAEAAKQVEQDQAPLPKSVADALNDRIKESLARKIPMDAWARRDRILEAYGFIMTPEVARAWREALDLPSDYQFKETGGVFPLDQYPDERRSLYHDCRVHFLHDYQQRYGLDLVYDKELAFKSYPSDPMRWTSAANSQGVRDIA